MLRSPNSGVQGSFVVEKRGVRGIGPISSTSYTYNNTTGVISGITFATGSIDDVQVGDTLSANSNTQEVLARTATTLTIAAGQSADYNGSNAMTRTDILLAAAITGVTWVVDLFEVTIDADASAAIIAKLISDDGTNEEELYRCHFGAAQKDGDNKGFAGIGIPAKTGEAVRVNMTNTGSTGAYLSYGLHKSRP